MKTRYLLFLMLIFCSLAFQGKSQDWIRIFGEQNFSSFPFSIQETYDKGFLINYRYQQSYNLHTLACLVKTDVNGNVLWKKTLGNSFTNNVIVTSAIETPDGGLMLCGEGGNINKGFSASFIMKLNPCMEKEWCRLDTASGFTFLRDFCYLPAENNFVLLREIYDTIDFFHEFRIEKLDAGGRKIWSNIYGVNPDYKEPSLSLKYSEFDNTLLLWGGVNMVVPPDSLGVYQAYLSKIALDGTIQWETYDVPDISYIDFCSLRNQPVVTENGTIIAPIFPPSGLLKLNSEGHFQSVYPIHLPDTIIANTVNSMELFQKNKLLIGLQNFKTGYDGLGNGVLQMTDTSGNIIREAKLPVNFTAIIYDIHETSDNKIAILASHRLNGTDFMMIKYNEDLEYDSLYLKPLQYDLRCDEDIISNTIEIDCTDYGVEEIPGDGVVQLQILPNPAGDFALIRLPEAISKKENQGAFIINSIKQDYIKNLKIEIYDLNGKLILQSQWPDNSKEQIFNISSWNKGLYLIRITNPNELIAAGKLVIK
jgi:hypothetical protein